jgi:hypothetical protein
MIAVKQPPNSLIGISFDDAKVYVAHLRRSGASVNVLKSFNFQLSESPLTGGGELLGAELKAKLAEHGIKERKCVVALPLHWILSLQTQIPELPEEDIDAFLETEAERNFPYGPDSMFLSSSRCLFPGGSQYNTTAAIPRDQLLKLQDLIKSAQLKSLSFSLGIAALQAPEDLDGEPVIILRAGDKTLEMEITCGKNGIAGLRSLQGVLDHETPEHLYADVVGRELRITLGQLPAELRGSIRKVIISGEQRSIEKLARDLAPRAKAMGLEILTQNKCSGALRIQPDAYDANPAICAATRFLLQRRPVFEFLPPKVSAWKQLSTKAGPRKFAYAGGVLAALALVVAAAFIVQNWKLSNLQKQWSAMEPRVKELEGMQGEIKRFRPWFDNSFKTMSILRKLTEAFPVDGVVSAKTIEIRDMSQVVCSGTARDTSSLYKMLEQLRNSKEIAEGSVKVESLSGKSPVQFRFNFRWMEGGFGEH